jgi:hypothetical protein
VGVLFALVARAISRRRAFTRRFFKRRSSHHLWTVAASHYQSVQVIVVVSAFTHVHNALQKMPLDVPFRLNGEQLTSVAIVFGFIGSHPTHGPVPAFEVSCVPHFPLLTPDSKQVKAICHDIPPAVKFVNQLRPFAFEVAVAEPVEPLIAAHVDEIE